MRRIFFICAFLVIAGQTRGDHAVVAAFERFYAAKPPSSAGGQLLLTELSCTACHAAPEGTELAPKGGPVLDGVAARVQPEWIRQFLSDPQRTKPGTTMPDVLAGLKGREREDAVEALVHLLATSTKPLT